MYLIDMSSHDTLRNNCLDSLCISVTFCFIIFIAVVEKPGEPSTRLRYLLKVQTDGKHFLIDSRRKEYAFVE